VGRFLRARVPTSEKLEPYECGEPPVGSSYVRFDLRFYVVALLFVIFDVEVAFFFPWATVFGKANELANPDLPQAVAAATYQELGVPADGDSLVAPEAGSEQIAANGRRLALASMADLGVFFGVLLVGFAYVWKRGDLNWVRAVGSRNPSDETGNKFDEIGA